MAGVMANAASPGGEPVYRGGAGAPSGGGGPDFGLGGGQLGSIFANLLNKPPGAAIAPAKVDMPNRADFGSPFATPEIAAGPAGPAGPSRAGIDETAAEARKAAAGFDDPTHTGAFTNLMGLAEEVTGAQESEQARQAADVSQRRGYAGGFEDQARESRAAKFGALATAGFQGAAQVRQEEGQQYGRAIGAFAQLQDSYNKAATEGNIAYAHDLTTAHIAQAEDALKTMELNSNQQLSYAKAVGDAKNLQATLLEQYNKDLIDNARFIQGNASIAAGLFGALASLQEKGREFNIESAERSREFNLTGQERQHEYDTSQQTGSRQFEEQRQDTATQRDIALRTQGKGPSGAPLSPGSGAFAQLGPTF